jgi:hypothetical protein
MFYTCFFLLASLLQSPFGCTMPPPESHEVLVQTPLVTPKDDTPLVPFTCPWAQDGLRKAMEGMQSITAGGVEGYGVGSRNVRFRTAAEQGKSVDYWMKMVEFYCGTDALPSALTGRDTACRIIPRDV